MDLHLKELKLQNFRNYHQGYIPRFGTITLFIGPNAIGKTNIIEALQLVTTQKSFRNPKNEYLLRETQQKAKVEALIEGDERSLLLEMQVSDTKKEFFLNEKKKNPLEIKRILPSVVFTPDDLYLVKGSLSGKRQIFDRLGEELTKNYYIIVRDYRKIILQKNLVLKELYPLNYIEALNEVFLTCASSLIAYRSSLVSKIDILIQDYYKELSGKDEILHVHYGFCWEDETIPSINGGIDKENAYFYLQNYLKKMEATERQKKNCLVGPHRDKIYFTLNGKDASLFGSQGQQRSIVLAYKMAEISLFQKVLSQKPLLLLDDVMSELDESRRIALLDYLSEGIQTCITATNSEYFDSKTINKVCVYNLPLLKQGNSE